VAVISLAALISLASRPGALVRSSENQARIYLPEQVFAPFPAIVGVRSVDLAAAVAELKDGESVIGLVADGAARAYPVDMIKAIDREVINDSLAGREVVVTWCGLCGAARAFARTLEGRRLTFFSPGLLWNRNMVMEDQETGTQWSQLLGRAMRGPLEGVELAPLSVVVTDWRTWREDHPGTTVALFERLDGAVRQHSARFPLAEARGFLIGLELNGAAHAWLLDGLRTAGCLNDEAEGDAVVVVLVPASATAQVFSRKVDGRVLSFSSTADGLRDDQTGTLWDASSGRALSGDLAGSRLAPLPAVVTTREAWMSFHPATALRGL
jgi:hypothetical protein